MTIENIPSDQQASVYYSVRFNSTELVLQPLCSRRQAMRAAWLSLLAFEVFILPLTILPTMLIMIFVLIALSLTAPELQNYWITKTCIMLLWSACLAAIAFLTAKAAGEVGYTTFTFDRIQKQFVIYTVNLFGRKFERKIAFEQIQDARLKEYESSGISISVCLLLEPQKILGFTRQENIILSSFSSEKLKTVANLIALKHHKELLRLVREILSLPTYELDLWLKNFQIPTEEELEQEKTQARLAAKQAIGELGEMIKMVFSSAESKQAELEVWRQKTRDFPEDPKTWEQFALFLALQKNVSKDELVSAYRRAETLYRDQGDMANAARMAQTVERLG